jgi:hypothetical protein
MNTKWQLTQIDAFFVAYQEKSGILMNLGVEMELKGSFLRQHVEELIIQLIHRYPPLGRRIKKGLFGLSWQGACSVDNILRIESDVNVVTQWRNKPIDPFSEPPFKVLWVEGKNKTHLLAIRMHHSVADGESFSILWFEAMVFLSKSISGEILPLPNPVSPLKLLDLMSPLKLLRRKQIVPIMNYTRWLAKEAKLQRSTRVAIRECKPGDIEICVRVLDKNAYDSIRNYSKSLGIFPAFLCAAAWVQAIHQWNTIRNQNANSIVSLEMPASLRRGQHRENSYGNFISPLTIFVDAAQPINDIARQLMKKFNLEYRNKSHFGVPLFTSVAKYLPWALFRRIAVTPTSTGFATSHFTWLEQPKDTFSEVKKISNGALELVSYKSYVPVCLLMGAALLAVLWPNGDLHLSITYRKTAFTETDVHQIADLLYSALVGQ